MNSKEKFGPHLSL